MIDEIDSIICEFDINNISNEKILDILCDKIEYIEKINQCGFDKKSKFIKILSKIKPEPNQKYSAIYLELAKIPELWKVKTHHNMTLLSYMAYGYDNTFFDCLFELTKYPELWEIKEKQHDYTALHFLVMSVRNFWKFGAIPILEKLSIYHNIWMMKSRTKNTPLHELCQIKDRTPNKVYKNLVINENLWLMQNDSLITPLHYLCTTRDKIGALETFQKLSKFEKIWSIQDEFLYTPLHIICRNIYDKSYDDFYEKMKIYPKLWDLKNKNGITPNDIYFEKTRENTNDEYDIYDEYDELEDFEYSEYYIL